MQIFMWQHKLCCITIAINFFKLWRPSLWQSEPYRVIQYHPWHGCCNIFSDMKHCKISQCKRESFDRHGRYLPNKPFPLETPHKWQNPLKLSHKGCCLVVKCDTQPHPQEQESLHWCCHIKRQEDNEPWNMALNRLHKGVVQKYREHGKCGHCQESSLTLWTTGCLH